MNATRLTTVENAFDMLEFLIEENGATVSRIADHLAIPESTAYDYVRTLRDLGYLTRSEDGYRASMRFMELGQRTRNGQNFYQVSREEIEELAQETGENVYLAVEENGSCILLDAARSERGIDLGFYPGCRLPLHATAIGRVLLTYLPEERRRTTIEALDLERYTDSTIVDREELRNSLTEIRKRGVAFNENEEYGAGIRAVAAPVFANDRLVGALSIAGPTNRMRGERFRETIPEELERTANIIEIGLILPVSG